MQRGLAGGCKDASFSCFFGSLQSGGISPILDSWRPQVQNRQLGVATLLIDAGADPNRATDGLGLTPLMQVRGPPRTMHRTMPRTMRRIP